MLRPLIFLNKWIIYHARLTPRSRELIVSPWQDEEKSTDAHLVTRKTSTSEPAKRKSLKKDKENVCTVKAFWNSVKVLVIWSFSTFQLRYFADLPLGVNKRPAVPLSVAWRQPKGRLHHQRKSLLRHRLLVLHRRPRIDAGLADICSAGNFLPHQRLHLGMHFLVLQVPHQP